MSNTNIQLRKSGVTGNVPASLELGELALNYADGKLYYKNGDGNITYFTSGPTTNSFSTIVANSGLLIATSNTDILSIVAANNITIDSDGITKTITIGASLTDSLSINSSNIAASANAVFRLNDLVTTVQGITSYTANQVNYLDGYSNSAFAQANIATSLAQSAYDYANTIGGATAPIDQFARDTANAAQSDIIVIQGVDTWQNTEIENVNQFTQSVYDVANSIQSTAQGAYDTANGKLASVEQDTNPKLGNNLDVNGHLILGAPYSSAQLDLNLGASLTALRQMSGPNGGVFINTSTTDTVQNTWVFQYNGDLKFPDSTIQSTAFTGTAIDQSARDTANVSIGVDETQNTRIQSIETINTNQNTSISIIQGINDTQNVVIGGIQGVDNAQNTSIGIIEGVNVTQNTRITDVEFLAQYARDTANNAVANTNIIVGVNNTQNTRINSIETVNNIQNVAIGVIQGTNLTQNTRLDGIEGVNLVQNTSITAVNQYAQSAYAQSNTNANDIILVNQYAQSSYDQSNVTIGVDLTQNTRLDGIEGTNVTQNTRINSIESINSNQNTSINIIQGVDLTQNTRLDGIEGVNALQNTNITSVNQFTQSAYNTANGANGLAAGAYNQANVTIGVDATQNTRLDGIEGTNATQNNRINSIETINTNQNTSINIIQGVDLTQNTRLDGIEGTNLTQNTNITAVNNFAQSGYNVANGANNLAQSAYDKANSANVLAQSAYDLAFTKFDANGGTIHGSVNVQGDINATGNITYSGSVTSQTITGNTGQFFGYAANGFNALYAGLPTGYTKLPNEVAEYAASNNSYVQINFQNENGGTDATTDWVATADNGTDTTNYVDLGIAGSGYDNTSPDNSLGTSLFPNDSYLYAQGNTAAYFGGNLVVGATTTSKVVKIIAGGIDASNVVTTFTGNNVLLSVPLVFADQTTMSSAPATIEYSVAAFNKANTVSANTIYTQGVDRAQNTAIGVIQGVNLATNSAINIIQGVDLGQNAAINIIQGVDVTQNTRLDGIESINAVQNTTISIIQGVDTTQNTRLNSIETINSNQNTTISIIQGVDATQNTRLDGIEGTNVTQNTNITAINQYAQSAYAASNTNATNITAVNNYAAGAYGVSNTNATNITAVNNYATSAYNQANVTAGGLTTANSNISIIQGVDLWQNNQITYVNQFAQAAFTKANTGVSSSNTFITVNANSSIINASSNTDTLTLMPGNNISFITDTVNKKITIASSVIPVTLPTLAPARTSFVAASAQTSIAITHTVPFVYVSINGVTVDPSEYTANGSYVVLTTALRIGDVVDVTGYITGISTVQAVKGDKGDVGSFTSNTVLYATDLYSTGNVSTSGDVRSSGGSVSLNATYNSTLYLQSINNSQNTSLTNVNNFAQAIYNASNNASNTATSASANTIITQGVDASQNAAIAVIQGVDTWQNNQITLVNQFAQSAYNSSNTKFSSSGGNITGPVTISGNNDLTVTGNLTVTGTTLYTSTTSFVTNDPVLFLGIGNYTSDISDIGFIAHYNDGANAHTGLIRDSGTKEYYFFKGYTPEADANNDININHSSFQTANINAAYHKGNVIGLSVDTANAYISTSLGVGTPSSGIVGEIRAANNILSYYTSDKQFKENIVDIPDALNKVDAIGGKLFDWTDDYLNNHGGVDDYYVRKNDFGVIAQDVQAVFPVAVRSKPDGSLAVDYEKLSALAFAAIKELKKEIDELKGKK